MPSTDPLELSSQFRQTLVDCRRLYVSSGQLIAEQYSTLLSEPTEQFLQRMDDLHRGLLVKIFITICEADRLWSHGEKELAEALIFHLWGQSLDKQSLHETIQVMSRKSLTLRWYSVIRPFDQIAPLRNRIGELETLVVRLANIIARIDGPMKSVEKAGVKKIVHELHLHLREIPIDEPGERAKADQLGSQAAEQILHDAERLAPSIGARSDQANNNVRHNRSSSPRATTGGQTIAKQPISTQAETTPAVDAENRPSDLLADALEELDRLVGLASVKHEVRTLTNFLKIQRQRVQANLPTTDVSLHMVFRGNPGTGKTTVARIVGKIYGAMGIIQKGHLVETDRSGLVAEYAGQTGPKTNRKIDEALDGVLFIDEAYTLISAEGDDPFGREAVQTLLKRMEDERKRLVVILAGYPNEMETLLRSNPGLSSRFSRNLEFVDYKPVELSRIFGMMCDKNRYLLDPTTRAKVMLGFSWLYGRRDRHFGNGRTARNLFEHAIRRMANRIAQINDLSIEQLSLLAKGDIEFPKGPAHLFERLNDDSLRFQISCPECEHAKDIPTRFLCQQVKCPKCGHQFTITWGSPVEQRAEI